MQDLSDEARAARKKAQLAINEAAATLPAEEFTDFFDALPWQKRKRAEQEALAAAGKARREAISRAAIDDANAAAAAAGALTGASE